MEICKGEREHLAREGEEKETNMTEEEKKRWYQSYRKSCWERGGGSGRADLKMEKSETEKKLVTLMEKK